MLPSSLQLPHSVVFYFCLFIIIVLLIVFALRFTVLFIFNNFVKRNSCRHPMELINMFLTVLLHSVHSIHPSKMSVRAPCTTACISHSTLITHTAGYLMHTSLSFIHHCSSLSSQNVHHVYVVVVCSYHECRQLSSLLSHPLILSIHSLILAFCQHPW